MTVEKLALELNLFCLAILTFILCRVLIRDDRQISQLKFRNMLIWHIAVLGVNAFAPYLLATSVDPSLRASISSANYAVYYIVLNMAIRSWFVYMSYSLGLNDSVRRRLLLAINVSTITMVFLNATSRFTHLFYYLQDGQVVQSPTALLQTVYLFAVQIVFAVSAYLFARRHMSRPQCRKILLISTYPVIPFVFVVLRPLFGSLPYLAVSNTMAILFIYVGYLDQLISLDPLTGINNRDQMLDRVSRYMQGSHTQNLRVIMLDIDCFKKINDHYGHLTGDQAIKVTAQALGHSLSAHKNAILARYGGDEFMICMQIDSSDLPEYLGLIDKEIDECSAAEHLACELSLSAGVAWYKDYMKTPEDFIAVADDDLYRKKMRKRLTR